MNGNSLWRNLKNLVEIDQKIKSIDAEMQKIQSLLSQNKTQLPILEENIKEEEIFYTNEKKNVTQQEISAKEFREKEEKEKKLLEKITNPKEYKAVEKELKAITGKRIMQDDALVKAWHELEEAEKNLNIKKKELEEKIKQIHESDEHQKTAFEDNKKRKEELITKRDESLKQIPQDWINKYERMIKKVSDPIVPVLDQCCSSCYYSILRQDLTVLKKSGVLPCRNCYRFLYCEQEKEE